MIDIKILEGVNLRSGQPELSAVQHIYDNETLIGVCEHREGGHAALFVPVSEALEDEIRQALDKRDGAKHDDRQIKLAPSDPRRQHEFAR